MPRPARPSWVDAALACAVIALGAVELATGQVGGPYWATVPSVLLFGVPLLWRRRFPWTCLLVVFGTILGPASSGASQYDYLASVASALLVMASFAGCGRARSGDRRVVLAAAALTVSALQGVSAIIWGVGLLAGAWAAGRACARTGCSSPSSPARPRSCGAAARRTRRRAVVAERARIARELHDVIAHSVGVMVVQAGAAERSIPLDPDRAAPPRGRCRTAAAQALADLRRLLGAAAATSRRAPATLAPQPGLDDVPGAARPAARRRPRRSRSSAPATPRPLPPGVGPGRLPHRAGGAHQRAQARGRGPRPRVAARATAGDGVDIEVGQRRPRRTGGRARRRARAGRHARARRALRRHVRRPARRRRRVRGPRALPSPPRDRTGDRPIRVLVADDQALVRAGFRDDPGGRAATSTVVGEAADGVEAVARRPSARPTSS